MLSRLVLSGFRACVDPTTLDLAPFTMIAGANNTGKSSFIGALLALVQSGQAAARHKLLLSGDWVDLGPYDQLVSPDRQKFTIGLEGQGSDGDLAVVWEFAEEPERRSRPEARVTKLEANIGTLDFSAEVNDRGELSRGASQLLHPARILRIGEPELQLFPYAHEQVISVGPYRAPPASLSPFRTHVGGSLVGLYGEYAAEAFVRISERASNVVPPGTRADEPVGRVMNAWWSYILQEEIAVRVEEVNRLGYTVRLDTRAIANRSFGQVGFGLSQLWPILVAALASSPGDLVIVETPEAHLHPGAQHRVAQLFVALARHGRQVIVETHSEHVVAAAGLAVKNRQISRDDLALSYFSQPAGVTEVERIPVDPSGRRLAAPVGFFDQSAQELVELLGP